MKMESLPNGTFFLRVMASSERENISYTPSSRFLVSMFLVATIKKADGPKDFIFHGENGSEIPSLANF